MILSVRSQTRKRKLHTIYCTVDGHIEFKCHSAVVNLVALSWHDLNSMRFSTQLSTYKNSGFLMNFCFFGFYLKISQ